MTIALIDADIVVYQSASRAEKIDDFDDDLIHITGSKRETRDGIAEMIHDLQVAVGADRVLLAFTCSSGNFRKEVYHQYKSNRKGHRKPITYQYGREWAIENYDSMVRPGLEADDILGIVATGEVKGLVGDKVVCSIDKDMRTFPCRLYNWMKPEDGIDVISETEADFNFYQQILTGDSVDGYPGCPGIGPVRAKRLLEQHWILPPAKTGVDEYFCEREAWGCVLKAYEHKGLVPYDAITQARCARILRACDYDFKERRPILWVPPLLGERDE
jgi:DNA polymerase-1